MSPFLRLFTLLCASLLLVMLSGKAQPKINSFSPASGAVGSTVTISGAGFEGMASNNIVYFGAVRAIVTGGSATSLTVSVPAGASYQPIAVLNTTTGLTGYSSTPFAAAFNAPSYSYVNDDFFQPKVDFTSGELPYSIATGDVDGDGRADLIESNYNTNTVSVLRNISSAGVLSPSSFAPKVEFSTGAGPFAVALSDLDGDGKLDIVVANNGAGTVSVLRNLAQPNVLSAASFAAKTDFSTGGSSAPLAVAVGDIDGDGKPDIVTANSTANTISVLRNQAVSGGMTAASFALAIDFAVGNRPNAVQIRDLDGDGKRDVVVSNQNAATLSVLRNTTAGNGITTAAFAAAVNFATNTEPYGVAVADVDGDGKPDLVALNHGSNTVSVLRNTSFAGSISASSFAARVDFSTGIQPFSLTIQDLTGDNKPEIITTNALANSVSVLENFTTAGSVNTSTSFFSRTDFYLPGYPLGVVAQDIDNDGVPEVIASTGSNKISVFKKPALPVPFITAVSPASGVAGNTVTITGQGFNPSYYRNYVYFGAVPAFVRDGSATSLTVTVPAGATYQPLSVLSAPGGLTAYSAKPFIPIFQNPAGEGIPANYYQPRVDFTTASMAAWQVVICDLDGDGKPDMAVANASYNAISLLRNISATGTITPSSFAPKADIITFNSTRALAVADINGDAKPDLIGVNESNTAVTVYQNFTTAGTLSGSDFARRAEFAVGYTARSLAIADLDSNGKLDIVVANSGSNTISLLRNITTNGYVSASSFAPKVDIATGSTPYHVTTGDVDGDGKPDLLVANSGGNTVSVFRNKSVPGDISPLAFETGVDFVTGTGPYNIVLADIDGDGKQDMAVVNSESNTLSVLRNTAIPGKIDGASFAAGVSFATSGRPQSLTAGDLDGDGKPDLAIGLQNTGKLAVLRNTATPGSISAASFAAAVELAAGTSTVVLSVTNGDLDSDGIPELVAAKSLSNSVCVFKIASFARPAAKITSFSPASGPVGTALTIKGSGFNTTPSNNTVYIGNVQASVTAATDSSLTVTVPGGTTHKPISVLNNTTGLTGYSSKPFITTFANPFGTGIPGNFYSPSINFFRANYPNMAVGDLDSDGKPDVVVAGSGGIYVFRNTSVPGAITTGSFSAPVSLTSDDIADIALGDIDGDGKIDIVSAGGTQTMSVWKNNATAGSIGAASFARTNFAAGYYPMTVEVGDLDGDGKLEVVTASEPSSSITISRNTSKQGVIDATSFAPSFDMRIGGGAFAINDLNGDGKPELITSGSGVSVSQNLSSPGSLSAASFATRVILNSGDGGDMVIGDIDVDGKPDIAYIGYTSTFITVHRNTFTTGSITTTSFTAPLTYLLGSSSSNPASMAINDLDGDGKPDLVCNSTTGVTILRNVSSAGSITSSSFSAPVKFSMNSNAVAAADLDGDGIPEIVSSNGISILRINNVPRQPVIVSFTPASGPSGSTVTVTGSNFNTTPAENIVYFGAVKAAVTASSASSLTVTVPAGATHSPVSVFNRGTSLIGYSTNPFNISFTNPAGPGAVPDNFYKQTLAVPTGILPYQVALGDLDLDGKADMVVVNENANSISIIRNVSAAGTLGDSSFIPRIDLPVGADPRAVAIGDVNVDGKPDIVVASSTAGTVTVYCSLGFANNSSSAPYYLKGEFAVGGNPFSVAIGDVDRDGQPDIVTANMASGTVSVLRNTYTFNNLGVPTFAPKVDFAAGSYPRSVAVSDLDGDGKADIAVINERSNTVSVLRNTAGLAGVIDASSFAPLLSFATGSNPSCITTSDVDGDSKPDLVTSNYGSNTVSVLRNTAVSGLITLSSFAGKVDFLTGAQPFFVAAAEVNGDGKPDLVTVNSGSNNLSVLRNTAVAGSITTGSFDGKVDFATGGYPVGIAGGDLDGDGITELVSANAANNNLSVLSFSSLGHPVVASVNPGRGSAGSRLTISGANFNADPLNNTVYFGAVKAAVTSGSSTSLTVTAPAGATYQPVSVLDNQRGLTGYSSGPFITTFANPFGSGIPSNFYRPRIDFALSGPFTYAVAFGDLDGDGKPDMVAVNEQAGTASVLRNASATGNIDAGSFESRVDIATTPGPRSAAIADMDGDGKLDIVVGSPASYTVSVLRNALVSGSISSSSFTRTDLQAGAYIAAFAVGDLDDDGRPDLVFANPYLGTVSVRRNLSAPGVPSAASFAGPVNFATGNFPRSIVVCDIDGDGKPEIVVANEQSGTVSVLRNTSRAGYMDASSFAAKVDFMVGSRPPALAAGDVDGDGKADLVVASYDSSSLTVLRNTGTPGFINASSFAPGVRFATGSNPYSVAIGDADGDGKADVITANSTANTVSVLRNTAASGSITTGSFAARVDFGAGGYPLHAALGDLDGDGIAELGIANAASGAISVLKIDGVAAMTAASRNSLAAVAEQQTANMHLYPNPTNGAFTLQLPDLKGTAAVVEIVNESGIVVERKLVNRTGSTTSLPLTLRQHPAGTYYVKVTGIDGVQVMKVVKR